MRRTACYGVCPAYEVTLFADGRVRWVGHDWVGSVGEDWARVDEHRVAKLFRRLQQVNWSLVPNTPDQGRCATDNPFSLVRLHIDGKDFEWVNYYGCTGPVYKRLARLDKRIDEIAGVASWIAPRPQCSDVERNGFYYRARESHPVRGDHPVDEWRREFLQQTAHTMTKHPELYVQLRAFDHPTTGGLGKTRVESYRRELIARGVDGARIVALVIDLRERDPSGWFEDTVVTALGKRDCVVVPPAAGAP